MARLFFAVWPSDEAAEKLAVVGRELAEIAGGKLTPVEKIHLTLAFLGEVAPERIVAAGAAAQAVESPPFDVTLDEVGAFRKSQVAWAGARRASPRLGALQAALAASLAAAGFALEERPFAPHLTLARRILRPVPRRAIAPIRWRVRDFTLVRSEPGTGRYSSIAAFPLASR